MGDVHTLLDLAQIRLALANGLLSLIGDLLDLRFLLFISGIELVMVKVERDFGFVEDHDILVVRAGKVLFRLPSEPGLAQSCHFFSKEGAN